MENNLDRGRIGPRMEDAVAAAFVVTVWLVGGLLLKPRFTSYRTIILVVLAGAGFQLAVSLRASDSRFVGTRAHRSSQVWLGAAVAVFGAFIAARMVPVETSWIAFGFCAFASALSLAVLHELGADSVVAKQRAVIIGTGEESAEWIALLEDHPELGIEAVGCIGDETQANRVGLEDRWLGPLMDLERLLLENRVDLPIVAVTSFRRPALQATVSRLLDADHDVAMSWGVGRVSAGRLATRTFSHETLPIIRSQRTSPAGQRTKRLLDIVASVTLLILTAPFMALSAIAIRLDSKGPVLFRQVRVGLDAQPFEIIKLRSMTVEAEAVKHELQDDNERNGPLFKMTHDPRVTRVGNILRKTSLDEIPQLINVLRGEMSLVGPRPALPEECESFDIELVTRSNVRPGITGLWQLEARANQSFNAYRRLDLHYLENWSIWLDLRIMVATAQYLVLGTIVKAVAGVFRSPEVVEAEAAATTEVATIAEPTPDVPAADIAVLGAGYVGLTQALGLVELGHNVVCADIDSNRVAELQAGIPPILEDGLEQLLTKSNESGRLTFTDDPVAAVGDADFVFLCVATPQREDGAADLRFLEVAARQISPSLKPGTVVINKSTVPVGSTEIVAGELDRNDVFVVSNPEFLREGTAIADWNAPDRIVVGGEPEAAGRVMDLYTALPGERIIVDAASAELIKYASNAYLATRLTFVNSLSQICDSLDADVLEVTKAMGLDDRIGSRYLTPGPGWGGSCFPKDTHALAYQADELGVGFSQLRATIEANEHHLDRAAEVVLEALQNSGDTVPVVAGLGLAFKAGTGDTRESPAVKVLERLRDAGVEVRAYDPGVVQAPIDGIELANTSMDCVRGADVMVVLTEWPEFKDLDFAEVAEVMNHKHIVDLRNLLDPADLDAHGFTYRRVGTHGATAIR